MAEPHKHRLRRSVLMTPASEMGLLEKQAASGADVALLDLEDSVPTRHKLAARRCAAASLQQLDWGGKERVVRTNSLEDELGEDDITSMAQAGADVVLLSKVKDLDEVVRAASIIDVVGSDTQIWCMIETAASLFNLPAVATASHVTGLFVGTGDLSLDLRLRTFGFDRHDAAQESLHAARSQVVMTARALGLSAIDSAMGQLDLADAKASAERAFAMGFDGKLIVTPAHVRTVHEAYRPSREEVAWAGRLIAALGAAKDVGLGSAVVDGEPIDGPYLGYALSVLEKAADES